MIKSPYPPRPNRPRPTTDAFVENALRELLESSMRMAILTLSVKGVRDPAVARLQITREVERIIQQRGPDYRDLELLREELLDELDDSELDAIYDRPRPTVELIADLCGDLGLTTVPSPLPPGRSADILPFRRRPGERPRKA